MAIITFLVNFAFLIVCVLLVVAILLQPGKGGSLASLGGGLESALGTRANVTMRNITIVLGCLLFALTIVLNKLQLQHTGIPKALRQAAQQSKTTGGAQGHSDTEKPSPAKPKK